MSSPDEFFDGLSNPAIHACAYSVDACSVFYFSCEECIHYNGAAMDADVLLESVCAQFFHAGDCFVKGLCFGNTVVDGVSEVVFMILILHDGKFDIERFMCHLLCQRFA